MQPFGYSFHHPLKIKRPPISLKPWLFGYWNTSEKRYKKSHGERMSPVAVTDLLYLNDKQAHFDKEQKHYRQNRQRHA
jgi:hypothetical protein